MELGREGSVPAACTEGLFYFYAGENVHSGDSCAEFLVRGKQNLKFCSKFGVIEQNTLNLLRT